MNKQHFRISKKIKLDDNNIVEVGLSTMKDGSYRIYCELYDDCMLTYDTPVLHLAMVTYCNEVKDGISVEKLKEIGFEVF